MNTEVGRGEGVVGGGGRRWACRRDNDNNFVELSSKGGEVKSKGVITIDDGYEIIPNMSFLILAL